ncbi:multi-sensor signal transduction histidine kinase [Leeuwenhoekiella aestuarii]|uniref:histidine kinase n=1 Tax=Leeuwenhoekiella aestuarii TaxID=2249426 RepID=A0A4Q0NWU1_9FLAO|nr:ATP-binding protein [Leeuwenhoekiella aestuarii]RXG15709.1 multi-sensor signal transduction histidine kinase [Leeuwenhoekiella aestuarii]RXG17182.1 multi-sensor signal transduction histidine kinase [Leeuwenhoekiella aestuarii]
MSEGPSSLYPQEVSLTNCDKEPIHILGKIQSHGYLLACDPASYKITYCSENIDQLFNKNVEEILGSQITDLLTNLTAEILKTVDSSEKMSPEQLHINGVSYLLIAHINEGNLVIEIEPFENPRDPFKYQDQLSEVVAKLNSVTDEQKMCDITADLIKDFFDYDRVMIYRFDENWDGIVVSEAREGHLESWLGLRYPASDIPQQARKLFLRQGVRIIADVKSEPVSIQALSGDECDNPIDLSISETRASSPIHIEYLENMNVGATLTAAIISKGNLWGLIACHHYSPKLVNYYQRQSCKFLTQVFSSQLVLSKANVLLQKVNRAAVLRSKLVEKISKDWNIHKGLTKGEATMLDITEATGAAVMLDDRIATVGKTPSEEEICGLVMLLKQGKEDLIVTANLSERHKVSDSLKFYASGVLCLFLSAAKKNALIWFKPEKIETVTWAGNPEKPVAVDENQRISPRKSFDKWSVEQSGKSDPWYDYEIAAAKALKENISEIILEKYEEVKELNILLRNAYEDLETFSYSVAHDLRAPLRGIDGFAQILKEDYFEQLDDFGKSSIETIINSSVKMNQLIDDILEFSKVSQAAVKKDDFSMAQVVQETVDFLHIEQDFPNTKITIDESMPPAYGDRKMVLQLMQNLLTNALKYTEKERDPLIEIGHTVIDQMDYFFVKDNGIGFDQKHERRIFKLFNRLVGDEYAGSGIGLTISQRIVKKHSGEIKVISEAGKGSTFLFNLG